MLFILINGWHTGTCRIPHRRREPAPRTSPAMPASAYWFRKPEKGIRKQNQKKKIRAG
jgi:hypothetical protein